MVKVRGRIFIRKVKRSYGSYLYPSIKLSRINEEIDKFLRENDEIIIDLSAPRPKKNNRKR